MKQLREIADFYDRFPGAAGEMAFALLYNATGSSYRKTGARMLIHLNGEYAGGISGGCLETDVVKKAKLAILQNRPEIVAYNTSKNANSPGSNLGCDGALQVLIHPLTNDERNPVQVIKRMRDSRKPVVLCTLTAVFSQDNGLTPGQVYDEKNLEALAKNEEQLTQFRLTCAEVLETTQSKLLRSEECELLFEFIVPAIHLLLIGGHRDILPMAAMGHLLGWKVTVCSNRKQQASNFSSISYDELNDQLIDRYTAVVFMSHDFDADVKHLPSVIDGNAFYLGILGPEKRKTKLLAAINRAEMALEIAGPIGFNLGAKSPEEIALATCAEIQSVFSKQTTLHLTKHKKHHEIKTA